ncbi:uncharacterized protein LOC112094456 [Morus notabilis]|uniref:uncharacterized protein LOC112094456 n=1 Tax=Morus notabilis TaxID=981085 RepID=UPI000CED1E2C|nr:uncharacterized protein LOC112094456 [Morus notabilis]
MTVDVERRIGEAKIASREVYQERFWTLSVTKVAKFSITDVAFTEEDANGVHFSHNDALVVEVIIGNHTVCRILVDNGSSMDILYTDCFGKMGIPKEQLEKTTRPLFGFTGDSVIPQGTIRLPITVGERPRQATTVANFVVIKGGSQYNAVIGRPTLQALRAITSVYHQKLAKVQVDKHESIRVLKIGSDLPPALKIEVEEFLRKNLDVFAWTHADTVGIDSQVICHALNVDPTFSPKCQKSRPMNPESNLNKACPKDSFPLPRIDQMVDTTAGHELLSFMDAYSGYNQILMHPCD